MDNIKSELNKSLLKIIIKWKNKTEKNMASILRSKGKGNSNLIKKLKLNVTIKEDIITVSTDIPAYAIYVDKGRKPGKQPPLKTIEKWCKSKGIKTEAAYPIARKIGEKGIKPTNFLNPMRKFSELMREVRIEFSKTATSLLSETKISS